jgi:H+/Na+-translocating ferredoxin:NAD+ oxidoreductase subunit G
VAEGGPIKTLIWVAVIATVSAALLYLSHETTRDRIAANRRARLLENLYSVLDPVMIHEDLNPVSISVTDPDLLGTTAPVEVFIVTDQGAPVAAIFASVAPHGYNAPIDLLVGISAASEEIMGVRAINHRETPGLGDLIDIEKSNWILQFDGKSLDDPEEAGWALVKEDGTFDSITGATVTPRAVIGAVHDTLLYFRMHKQALFREAARAEQEVEEPF